MTPAHDSRTADAVQAALTLSDQPGHTPPHPAWSPAEQWVWQRLCEGEIADFNAREGKILDPSHPAGWDETRTVRAAFLDTVLLREPYRSALPRQGVRLVGARFDEATALDEARLGHMLWLDHTRFEQEVQLSGVKSTESVSLEGAYFAQTLDLSRVDIEGHLMLGGARVSGGLTLLGSRVGGQLDLHGGQCAGPLNLHGLEVKWHLLMHTQGDQVAQFADVDLLGARIGGQLNLRGARCTGMGTMQSLEVASHVFLENVVVERAIDLKFARLGGEPAGRRVVRGVARPDRGRHPRGTAAG
jgi:hypothetical protein